MLRRWLVSEDEALTRLYLLKTNDEIAQIIGRSCAAVPHRLRKLGLKRPYVPTIKHCQRCGKEFQVNPRQVRRGGGKFCSKSCTFLSHQTRITKKCLVCQKEIVISNPKRFETANFCSAKCWGQYRWLENKVNMGKLLEELKKSDLPIVEFANRHNSSYQRMKNALARNFPNEYKEIMNRRKTIHKPRYTSGKKFEHVVWTYFKNQGYYVMMSAHSEGPFDIVALKKGEILLVQCKEWRGYLRNNLIKEELIRIADDVGGQPIIAHKSQEGITLKLIK